MLHTGNPPLLPFHYTLLQYFLLQEHVVKSHGGERKNRNNAVLSHRIIAVLFECHREAPSTTPVGGSAPRVPSPRKAPLYCHFTTGFCNKIYCNTLWRNRPGESGKTTMMPCHNTASSLF